MKIVLLLPVFLYVFQLFKRISLYPVYFLKINLWQHFMSSVVEIWRFSKALKFDFKENCIFYMFIYTLQIVGVTKLGEFKKVNRLNKITNMLITILLVFNLKLLRREYNKEKIFKKTEANDGHCIKIIEINVYREGSRRKRVPQ